MAVQYISLDGMLKHVGEFGPFQWMLDAVFSIMIIPQTFQILIMYFAALNPTWKCSEMSTMCNVSTIFAKDDNTRCKMERSDWEFTQPKDYSIATQFYLVCDDEWLTNLSTSILFIGWIFGAIFLGWVADNYGRKIVYFPSTGILLVIGFITAYSPNIATVITLRFIAGFFIPGTSANAFVMISEVVGGKYRSFGGMIIFLFFTAALCIQGLKAYFIQTWKTLFIVCTAPYIFVLLFYVLVPESIRWLKVKGKSEQLHQIFIKIAKWNKKTIPENTRVEENVVDNTTQKKATPLDLFRTRKLVISTLSQGYIWMVNGMVYYGLALAADDLGGSLYLNYVLVSLVEIPACFCAIYLSEKIGRKKTITSTLGMGSIACIIVAFIPETGNYKYGRIIFGMLGKFFVTIDFDCIYTWSVELYPTSLRSQGMGFLQVASRIGSASSPFIAKGLSSVHKTLPFITMGSLALIGFGLCFLLPETKGKEISEYAGDNDNKINDKSTAAVAEMKGNNSVNNTAYDIEEVA